jgi:hypothetical protein
MYSNLVGIGWFLHVHSAIYLSPHIASYYDFTISTTIQLFFLEYTVDDRSCLE